MPPKVTTRGRGRGRGRGGAARGAAAAAAATSSAPLETEPSTAAAEPATAATTEPAGPAPVPDMAAPSSNPTPEPSSSSRLPSSTPAPTTSSTRGSSSATAAGAGGSKFKPKGVRRSEAERARLAEEQSRIQEQRNAEEARRLARLNRGRGTGRGRGRGGLFRGNMRSSAAAGPLSAGMSFGGGGPSGSGGYAFASGSGSGGAFVKGEAGTQGPYGSSSIIDNSRINADMLYNYVEISDEDDGSAITSTKKKKKAIMPMGIRRVEHKEEGVTMTTAAEIEAQEKAGVADAETAAVSPSDEDEDLFVAGATHADLDEDDTARQVSIKREEGEGGGHDAGAIMDLDAIPEGVPLKTPDSPELTKKKPLAGDQQQQQQPPPPPAATNNKKKLLKDPEAEINAEELHHMLELFTVHGDAALAQTGAATNAALEGHMFLFQFPPVLPPLREVEGTSAANAIPVKAEPEDDDVVMLGGGGGGGGQAPVNIDLTQEGDNTKVKKEGGGGGEGPGGKGEGSGDVLREGGGFLGNLVVRKSGKVELSWGGQVLEMMPGIQTNFLSTAALIEHADVKPGEAAQQGAAAGVAYGMGKIQGSFTLAPQWGDEEDWVVDPSELEIRSA